MLWSALMTVEIGAVSRQDALLLEAEWMNPVLLMQKYDQNTSSQRDSVLVGHLYRHVLKLY